MLVMLETPLSRIGLLIAISGFLIWSVSLFFWVEDWRSAGGPVWSKYFGGHKDGIFAPLLYESHTYEWVYMNNSLSPSVEDDEIWQLSSTCQKQFYKTKIDEAHKELAAYDDSMPNDLREWLKTAPKSAPWNRERDLWLEMDDKRRHWNFDRWDIERKLEAYEKGEKELKDKQVTAG